MVLSLALEKIPSDSTGDRSRDLPTSSAVHKVEYVVLMKHFLFAETFEDFDTKVLEVSTVTLSCGCRTNNFANF
jgi:hypothetical protein